MNIISRLKKNILKKTSRLKKRILADWQQYSVSDPNIIQILTDAMTYGFPVQINYQGSGWRNIVPYGWNTSKNGDVLIMCYKDTGEVRSYRLDKVEDLYIDSTQNGSLIGDNPEIINNNQIEQTTEQNDIQLNQIDEMQPIEPEPITQIDMPLLETEEVHNDKPGEFDDELSLLNNNEIDNQPESIEQNNESEENNNDENQT